LLSGSVVGGDGSWPHEAVREVIEEIGSDDLDQGIETGVYNSRGVVSRDPATGGAGERALAVRYAGYAAAVSSRWPRTAAVLRSIAEMYQRDGRREDLEAEVFEDR
jgi:hypothetical protein